MKEGSGLLNMMPLVREMRRRAQNIYRAARGHRLAAKVQKPSPPQDITVLLHHSRSARLRQVPPGAKVICSAGCAGTWYFDWVENCYGRLDRHIGVEYYTPKPEQLPNNVEWVENTVSDMSAVGDNSCDLIFSGQNLEHLWPEEVIGFLLESWRVLRAGGTLVIDSPNRELTEPLNWSHPEHTVELTFDEARQLVTLAGFDITGSYGVWLCRDPKSGSILPFKADDETSGWSVPERLILASKYPSDSFIWWLEATKSARNPDRKRVESLMSDIFDRAWPERIQRLKSLVGRKEHRADGDWIVCEEGESGVMLFGPNMPLKMGNYRVSFCIKATTFEDSDQPIARCEVIAGDEPLVSLDIQSCDPAEGPISLEFRLSKLTFGMKFRCLSLGVGRVECWRGIVLDKIGD